MNRVIIKSQMYMPSPSGVGQISSKGLGRKVEGIIFCGAEVELMFPEFVEAATALNASKGQDVLRSADGPAHARLFAAAANDRFTTRLHHARADEEALIAKGFVLHPADIVLEVAQRLLHGGRGGGSCRTGPRTSHQVLDPGL